MQETNEYTYERVSKENLHYIKELYLDCFKENVPLEFLKKKYDTFCFGLRDTGYIALSKDGKPAAYYGVFPVLFTYNGEDILAAQSGDTMTHSNHRGRGLFVSLAKKTYELAKDSDVKFIFGFPNEQSYRGFVKLGWKFIEPTNKYEIPVSTLPAAKLSQKFSGSKSIYSPYARYILKKYQSTRSSFDNPLKDKNVLCVKRDENYFEYKSYYPKHLLNINGHLVWMRADGPMLAGDVENPKKDSFSNIIASLKKIAFRLGSHKIIFQTCKDSELDKCLSAMYKPSRGLEVGYLILNNSEANLNNLKVSFADFDTF